MYLFLDSSTVVPCVTPNYVQQQISVEALSEEEEQLAAYTSFAYWYTEQQQLLLLQWENSCLLSLSAMKRQSAMKEARRHWIASGGDFTKALDRLKDSCRYRKVSGTLKKMICIYA